MQLELWETLPQQAELETPGEVLMKQGSCEQPWELFQYDTSPQAPPLPVMSWDQPFSPGRGVGRAGLSLAGALMSIMPESLIPMSLVSVTTAQSPDLLSTYCVQVWC